MTLEVKESGELLRIAFLDKVKSLCSTKTKQAICAQSFYFLSMFPNEAPPHYTSGPSQPIQQAPYPGQNQGPYPGPQQGQYPGPQLGPYSPGPAPYPGQDYYGGQQPPPGGAMYPPQQGAYFTGQGVGPPPPPTHNRQKCMDTFCCCLAGYCACQLITDMLCCICDLLGND